MCRSLSNRSTGFQNKKMTGPYSSDLILFSSALLPIQGHESFWGQLVQLCLFENRGRKTNDTRANATSRITISQEKLSTAITTPAKTGMNHKGTITGICLLNFPPNRLTSFFSRSLAATRPYPQGQHIVPWRSQNGHTNIIIQNAPATL